MAQKTLSKMQKNSTKNDKNGRTKGFVGTVNQWQNSQNKKFYGKVQATRNGDRFGACQPQKEFETFEEAAIYIAKSIDKRIAKLEL